MCCFFFLHPKGMFRLDLLLAGNRGPPQALKTLHLSREKRRYPLQVNPSIFETGYRTGSLDQSLATMKGWGTTTAFPQDSLRCAADSDLFDNPRDFPPSTTNVIVIPAGIPGDQWQSASSHPACNAYELR